MIRLTDLLKVLGSVSPNEYWAMEKEWKDFVENPKKYQGTSIEEDVRTWLKNFREEHKDETFIVGGCNWTFYYAYTEEALQKFYKEITGTEPTYDWTIMSPKVRDLPTEYDHMYAFRLHI